MEKQKEKCFLTIFKNIKDKIKTMFFDPVPKNTKRKEVKEWTRLSK